MHSNSLELFRRFALPYFRAGMMVLELGPEEVGFCRRLLPHRVRYHFADLTNAGADQPGHVAMTPAGELCCSAETFDVVFSANVIEHVPRVWDWMREQSRVLRHGGLVICVNPVSWPYHEAPVDCWRMFPAAYRALFDEVGLTHVFSWHGNLVPLDPAWVAEHGPHTVTDTIAIGRKP